MSCTPRVNTRDGIWIQPVFGTHDYLVKRGLKPIGIVEWVGYSGGGYRAMTMLGVVLRHGHLYQCVQSIKEQEQQP